MALQAPAIKQFSHQAIKQLQSSNSVIKQSSNTCNQAIQSLHKAAGWRL
jgi:hypothetical protein